MASLDVTLTGLEERVTKMEERADVINEVEASTFGSVIVSNKLFCFVPLLFDFLLDSCGIMRLCWFEDLSE